MAPRRCRGRLQSHQRIGATDLLAAGATRPVRGAECPGGSSFLHPTFISLSSENRSPRRARFFRSTFLYDVVRLPRRRLPDSSRGNANRPLVSDDNRVCADVAANCHASFHNHGFTFSIGRYAPKAFFTSILKNKGNGLCKALAGFFPGQALAIRARYFRAIADVPFPIALEDSGEFVSHGDFRLLQYNRSGGAV